MSCDLFSTTCAASGPSTYCDIVSPPSEVLPLRLRTGLRYQTNGLRQGLFFSHLCGSEKEWMEMEWRVKEPGPCLFSSEDSKTKMAQADWLDGVYQKETKRRVYVESALISSSAKSRVSPKFGNDSLVTKNTARI